MLQKMKQLIIISVLCNCNTCCLELFVTFLQLEKYCTLQFGHIQNLDGSRRVWYENYRLILDVCIFTITLARALSGQPCSVYKLAFLRYWHNLPQYKRTATRKWQMGTRVWWFCLQNKKTGTFPVNSFLSTFGMNYNYCQQHECTSDTQGQTRHKVQEWQIEECYTWNQSGFTPTSKLTLHKK
jgi:hypothetical protein